MPPLARIARIAPLRRRLGALAWGGVLTGWVLLAQAQPAPLPASWPGPCEPSGVGRDYQVGPAPGQIESLDGVPWERLGPGDTVRVFHRSEPYRGKILLMAEGRAEAPVRLCGVKGPQGERPVIDGRDAVTRPGLRYGHPLHESRAIILVNRLGSQDFRAYPSHIQIDGLAVRSAHPRHAFTDAAGQRRPYEEFGACIWVERGHHVTIADNEISDCTHAVFSRSTPDGDFSVTKHLRLTGNHMHGNGVARSYTIHTTYLQSMGVVVEFNRYGPMRPGATGNAIKDRSTGTVIRYNRIEDGARAIDLVEAEDFTAFAQADPAYRETFVYGNQIIKDGRKGSVVHYGGDHPGSEASYRKGTLYFFHNTVHVTGTEAALFQLSTLDEKAEVWNNVFTFDPAVRHPRMRMGQDNAPGIPSGGIVNLGRNWIGARWSDAGPYHRVDGRLTGTQQQLTGPTSPVAPDTLHPLPRSPIIDAALPGPAAADDHPVSFQLDPAGRPVPRVVRGKAADLGAQEL